MVTRARGGRRGERGAVYVEFLLAFLPLLTFFECLVQLAGLYSAKQVVMHAAESAARAAVVVLHDDPQYYGNVPTGSATGQRRSEIEAAASIPLRAIRSIVAFDLKLPSQAGGNDDRTQFASDDTVRVRLEATYRCSVPLAGHLVCNFLTGRNKLTGEAVLPNHGVDYAYSNSTGGTP